MITRDIFLILDVMGLGMLLGGAVYESVVVNPNYRSDIPQSLQHVRHMMSVRTPAHFFRVTSPLTLLCLVVSTILCWESLPIRWWLIAALLIQMTADTITYTYHYPRNKVLFIDALDSDSGRLGRLAREWQHGNEVRIVLLALSIACVMSGIFLMK